MGPEDAVDSDAVSDDASGAGSADPGSSSDEGPSSGPATLDDVADAFDADALAEAGASADSEEGQSEGSGKPKGGTRDPLDVFIDTNYKGNKDAFLQAQYESRAEAKRLKEENEALRQRTGASPSSPSSSGDRAADLKAAREASPEVQSLDREIKSIDARLKAISEEQLELVASARKADSEIAKLTGQLSKASDADEKADIRASISEQRAELRGASSDYKSNETREENLRASRATALRDLKRIDKEIEHEVDERVREAEAAEESAAATRETFAESFDTEIKLYDIDMKSKKGIAFRRTVQNELATYLESLPDNAKRLDAPQLNRAVKKLIAGYAEAYTIKPRTARSAPTTVPGRRPVVMGKRPSEGAGAGAGARAGDGQDSNTNPAPSPKPKNVDDLLGDPAYVRKRANAIFQAEAKGNAARGRRGIA